MTTPNEKKAEILEELADLEHEQWMEWSKAIEPDLPLMSERRARWKRLWIPYDDLSEEMKEHDRKYARKVLQILSEYADWLMEECMPLEEGCTCDGIREHYCTNCAWNACQKQFRKNYEDLKRDAA